MATSNELKRKERQKQSAEVFTPPSLITKMLNKLPKEVWHRDKTFVDPSCGNGNMLVMVLWRKISRGHKPIEAIKTVYGVDIMQDNVRECRLRLLKLVSLWEDITEEHIRTVFTNIRWICAKRQPAGALAYDFSFGRLGKFAEQSISRWYKCIHIDRILDEVELPVDEEKKGFIRTMPDIFEED